MRTLLLGVAVTLLLVPPAMAQGGEERWEMTITFGPCEAFAEGNFTVFTAGPSDGTWLVSWRPKVSAQESSLKIRPLN